VSGGESYVPTALGDVGKALQQAVRDAELGGSRTAQQVALRNTVIVVNDADSFGVAEPFLDELEVYQPGRFFVIGPSRGSEAIQAEVAARCRILPDSTHRCSTVTRLRGGFADGAIVTSVLNAHMESGAGCDVVLLAQPESRALLKTLVSLADRVLLDSHVLPDGLAIAEELSREVRDVVDLSWLRLSPWRELLRVACSQAAVRELVQHASDIVVRMEGAGASSDPRRDAEGLMLLGWVASRLGFEPISYSGQGFVCSTAVGRKVSLNVVCFGSRLVELALMDGTGTSLRLRRGRGIEALLESGGAVHYKMSHVIESESTMAVLRRYFAVGESITNYKPALHRAIQLEGLARSSGVV